MRTRFVGIFAVVLALAGCTDVAPEDEATAQETTRVSGKVQGYVASGDTLPLAGVKVEFRSLRAGFEDLVLETVSGPDGSYHLDIPRGWASVTFDHEAYTLTSRTENFTKSAILDVQLPPNVAGSEFVMPQPGDAPVMLTYDSASGRDYARLRIEPGDLVDASGRPAEGKVMAYVAVPHPRDTHKDAFPRSLYTADDAGIGHLEPFGWSAITFAQGDEMLQLAPGQSVDWEVVVSSEQKPSAEALFASGAVQEYVFDPAVGFWESTASAVDFEDGRFTVQRTTLGEALVGGATALPYDPAGEFSFRSGTPKCVEPGSSVLMMLTMSNPLTPPDVAASIIRSTISYLADGKTPRVLVVLDDNHNNEFPGDAQFIGNAVAAAGYSVTVMNEPSSGLRPSDVTNYDIVWFTNPGHPIDDMKTLETLKAFRLAGGGYVLSGDDITQSTSGADLSAYTFSKFKDNGTVTCGKTTNNNQGAAWRVTFEDTDHPLSATLSGLSFLYGDDLDHSTPIVDGEDVLAWAVLDGYPTCKVKIPVAVAIDIEKSSQYTPCACTSDNDCSGAMHCDDDVCATCSVRGYSCVEDGDCCGDLVCNDGVCGDSCQGESEACGGSTECCGSMSCFAGACASCTLEGADCETDGECCGGLLCVQGTCQGCRGAGETCGETADCCNAMPMSCNTTTTVETVTDTTSCAGDRNLAVTIRDFSKSHADFEYRSGSETGIVTDTLGPDKKPVYAGNPKTYTTNGQLLFDQWFRDVPNVNKAISKTLQLTEVSPGIYQYKNNAFFPIDGQGFGNEGNNHNFHFTLEMHTEFVYRGGEIFTFTGDDDLFAYINKKLVIDLGGVHEKLSRTIDLDTEAPRLGLKVGHKYPLDVFFAERHTTESNFRIDTTIGCLGTPVQKTVTEQRCEPIGTEPEVDCGGGEGVVGLSSVNLSGGAAVRTGSKPGHVASNGEIRLTGGAYIQGNATTAGNTIYLDGGAWIGGTKKKGATTIVMDPMTAAFAKAKITNNNAAIPSVKRGTQTVSVYSNGQLAMQEQDNVKLPAGDYYLTGLTVTASAKLTCTGNVRMFVSGKVVLAGNARVNEDGGCNLVIYGDEKGDLDFTASALTRAFVYAPKAPVKVSGAAALYGGAVARDVDLSGSGMIYVQGSPVESADACIVIEPEEDPNMPNLPDLPDLES